MFIRSSGVHALMGQGCVGSKKRTSRYYTGGHNVIPVFVKDKETGVTVKMQKTEVVRLDEFKYLG